MRFCDLTEKEVINVCDCKCLGNVHDLDIDECDGRIRALIVPGPGKWFGCFCREFELFIPWCKIVRIGPDIILVDIDEKEAKHMSILTVLNILDVLSGNFITIPICEVESVSYIQEATINFSINEVTLNSTVNR